VALGPDVSEQTQQESLLLEITNRGGAACYLFGYPGISLYDAQGKLLPLSYKWQGDQEVTSAPPQQVNLAPGATAYVLINEAKAGVCLGPGSMLATTLRFIPPDTTSSFTLNLQGARNMYSCPTANSGMLNTLAISPVESTGGAIYAPLPTPRPDPEHEGMRPGHRSATPTRQRCEISARQKPKLLPAPKRTWS